MLSLVSASLSFSAPVAPRIGASRVGSIVADANEMEPTEGWNVDNLTNMMDDAVGAAPVAAVVICAPRHSKSTKEPCRTLSLS